jgi:choice-of-anchor B domain-containing protein
MKIRQTYLLIVGCLLSTAAFSHSGDEPPLYVAPDGVDTGLCQDADSPCRTIDYALGKLGKGAQLRVASGSYLVSSENELFHLLHGSIDIRGSFDDADVYQTESQNPTVLSGVPREYAAELGERGFMVAPDNKLMDRDSLGKVRKQLRQHEALQSSMAAAPCTGGSVNGMDCQDIDLLSHVGLGDISASPGAGADVWGFVDLNSDREYAVVGFSTGTAVFDVTDAENPREVGFIDGQTASWRDIKVYQFWNAAAGRWNAQAYITTDGSTDGLFVIDLSGLPHSIQRVNYAGDFTSAHNVFATNADYGTGLSQTGAVPTMVVAGSNINSGPYRAYSVNDPTTPDFEVMPGSGRNDYMHDAASMIITDGRKDTQCVNATTYCELLFDFNEDTVDIWDITVTSDPRRLSSTGYVNANYVHSGWPTEDKQYLFIHDEGDERAFGLNSTVNMFDLSDLTSPASLTPWTGPVGAIDHNGFVRGNRYYMSNYSRGLTILDITNATLPQEVGFIDTFPATDGPFFVGAWGAYPYFHSGNIAVSDIDTGFYMVADRTLDVAEGSFAFSSRSFGGDEGTQIQIPVQRLGSATGIVSVAYEILGATADGNDVDGGSGVLNWGNGDNADKFISLDLLSDGDAGEGLERLFVKLVAPTGGATLNYQNISNVYISEPGAAGDVEFANAQVRIAERGFATAVAVVQRNGSSVGAASVDYTMTAGDATAGTDFQGGTSGTINWADGDASPKSIEFAIEDDGVSEPTEFFELSLQNASGAAIGATATTTVTIADGAGSNNAPNAVAGAGQTVASGAIVTLDGSGSNDSDGDALTYQWIQTAGTNVTLMNSTSATASFTAPNVTSDTLLQFRVTVSDGLLQSTALTSVTVQRTGGLNKKSGGGGAIGWLFLFGMALLGLSRRR